MRTKALIVGAIPEEGFESIKLNISEVVEWKVSLTILPRVIIDNEIVIEVTLKTGVKEIFYLHQPINIKNGIFIQALVVKTIKNAKSLTIILEEV